METTGSKSMIDYNLLALIQYVLVHCTYNMEYHRVPC